MASVPHPAFLRLVHSDANADNRVSVPVETQAQNSFLPSSLPNTLIFLSWSKLSLDELLDVLELSKPKIIFDLRIAPRFDLGTLTRKRFFDLLSNYNCQYVDLFGRMEISNLKSASANPILVAEGVSSFSIKLPVPNGGPFVFFHDENFLNDEYVRRFAEALPCSARAGWQLYRPHSLREVMQDPPREDRASAEISSTPLVRTAIFVSHATPQDNSFVVWLTSKLIAAGYDVWCDVVNLGGGDIFWAKIENIISTQAVKVLFIQSEHIKDKSGPRKEAYLALKTAERNRLTRFVIPMRIDATPFDETLIELIDIQSIDCRYDWLAGLKNLLLLLQRDGVPRSSNLRADQFAKLTNTLGEQSYKTVHSNESLVSNFLPIVTEPQCVNFFSCSGLQSNQLPHITAALPVPAYAYYTHIGTTASQDRLVDALKSVGIDGVAINLRTSIPWSDYLDGDCSDLPRWKRSEARNWSLSMLNKAWAQYVLRRGAVSEVLANNRPLWFFADQKFEGNKVRFSNWVGQSVSRQLVGFSNKRRVYWHFGIQSRGIFVGRQLLFALTPHVTFSSDGRVPLESKAQLHSLRRSFCRSWWNDRWRDLMQAFVYALGDDDRHLAIDIGSDAALVVAGQFEQFISPLKLVRVSDESAKEGSIDDEIEDQWDEDYDDQNVTDELVDE